MHGIIYNLYAYKTKKKTVIGIYFRNKEILLLLLLYIHREFKFNSSVTGLIRNDE